MIMTTKVTQSGDVEGDLLAHPIASEKPPNEDVPLAALDGLVGGDGQARPGPVNPPPPLTHHLQSNGSTTGPFASFGDKCGKHFLHTFPLRAQWVWFWGYRCRGNTRPIAQVGVDVVDAGVSIFNE